jgi:hypothetical protein
MDARFLAVAGLKGGTGGGGSFFPQPTNAIAATIASLRIVDPPSSRPSSSITSR